MTRHCGRYDFNERPAVVNIGLCPQEPVQGMDSDDPERSRFWPIWHLRGSSTFGGFGVIAASEVECENHEKQWIRPDKAQ